MGTESFISIYGESFERLYKFVQKTFTDAFLQV